MYIHICIYIYVRLYYTTILFRIQDFTWGKHDVSHPLPRTDPTRWVRCYAGPNIVVCIGGKYPMNMVHNTMYLLVHSMHTLSHCGPFLWLCSRKKLY